MKPSQKISLHLIAILSNTLGIYKIIPIPAAKAVVPECGQKEIDPTGSIRGMHFNHLGNLYFNIKARVNRKFMPETLSPEKVLSAIVTSNMPFDEWTQTFGSNGSQDPHLTGYPTFASRS